MSVLVVASAQPLTVPATESETFVVATSAEQVMGTWHAGNHYLRFGEDGVLHHAVGKDALDSRPYVTDAYRFEDGVMVIAELACWSTIPCREVVGRYEVRLLADGNLRIVEIEDRCRHRAGDIAWVYELVERVATSAEQVIGTWHTGTHYLRFGEDGTFRQAVGRDALDTRPYVIDAFRFEEGVMLVTEVECWSTIPCGDTVGRYEVRLLGGGSLRIVEIEDRCRNRAGELAWVYARGE